MTTRHLARTTILAALALLPVAALAAPADAAGTVAARGVQLSKSASCRNGDIEIEYSADAAERQLTSFTAEGDAVHQRYDVAVYSTTHDGTEYILSQSKTPPPAGTIMAVHVTIGTSPPTAASGEFFVTYRCDSRTNAQGGNNVVLDTCFGSYGTCPTSANDYLARGAAAPAAVPRFTG